MFFLCLAVLEVSSELRALLLHFLYLFLRCLGLFLELGIGFIDLIDLFLELIVEFLQELLLELLLQAILLLPLFETVGEMGLLLVR